MKFKEVIDKADSALSSLKLSPNTNYAMAVALVNASLELLQLAFFYQSLETAATKAKEESEANSPKQSNVPSQEEIAEFRARQEADTKAQVQANLPLDNT